MSNLSDKTPLKNVWYIQIITFLYGLSVFINENFDLICKLGLDEKAEKGIQISGLAIYFFCVFYNFNKKQKKTKPTK